MKPAAPVSNTRIISIYLKTSAQKGLQSVQHSGLRKRGFHSSQCRLPHTTAQSGIFCHLLQSLKECTRTAGLYQNAIVTTIDQLRTAINGCHYAAFAHAHGFHYGVGHALVKGGQHKYVGAFHIGQYILHKTEENKMLFQLLLLHQLLQFPLKLSGSGYKKTPVVPGFSCLHCGFYHYVEALLTSQASGTEQYQAVFIQAILCTEIERLYLIGRGKTVVDDLHKTLGKPAVAFVFFPDGFRIGENPVYATGKDEFVLPLFCYELQSVAGQYAHTRHQHGGNGGYFGVFVLSANYMRNLPTAKHTQKPQETGHIKIAFKVYMRKGQSFFLRIFPNNAARGTAYKYFVTTCSESGGGHQHPLFAASPFFPSYGI